MESERAKAYRESRGASAPKAMAAGSYDPLTRLKVVRDGVADCLHYLQRGQASVEKHLQEAWLLLDTQVEMYEKKEAPPWALPLEG